MIRPTRWLGTALVLFVRPVTAAQNVSAPIAAARASVAAAADLSGQKVIGGTLADFPSNSWQVALVLSADKDGPRVLFCGGTLLTKVIVVTAAHCVDNGTQPTDFDVIAGGGDIALEGVRIRPRKVVLHPSYNLPTLNSNDVALIELRSDAPMQSNPISIIDPADDSKLIEGTNVRATGWGAVSSGSGQTRDLRQVEIKIISNEHCNDPVSYDGKVNGTMVCAGSPENRDTCQGDSGGPLTGVLHDNRTLIGVVSWGEGCGQPAKWGVYARLTAIPWVTSCLAAGGNCFDAKGGTK